MLLVPISLKDANAFVAEHHRHHKPVVGHKFSIGCAQDGKLVGVAIVGRPVSRYLDNGREKRLQYAVCCGGAGGKGHGLSEDHYLHPGHRAGGKPAGRWLDVHGTGRGKTLDRQTLSRCGSLSTPNETEI